jgi:20S proteasome alpha/beta subunit
MEDVYTLPDMTLGIAIEAIDGVVLASDSQETRSDLSLRSGVRKIVRVSETMAVAVAGTGNVARGILEHPGLLEHARSLKDAHLIGDFFGNCFLGHMQGHSHEDGYFKRTYHLKDGSASPDVLRLSLVLAAYNGDRSVIGEVSPETGYGFSPQDGYRALGVTPFANGILSTLFPLRKPLPSVKEAKLIATLCLALTADGFLGVGEPFDFVTITKCGYKATSTDEDKSILESVRLLRETWRRILPVIVESGSTSTQPRPGSP